MASITLSTICSSHASSEGSIQDGVHDIVKHDQCGCDEPLVNPPPTSSESRIIEQTTTHVEDDEIKARLPNLVCSSEVHHVTKAIGYELGIVSPGSATRNLRAIVFVRLDPITSLQGKDFVLAWVDCVECHYTLWTHGIHSVQPTLDNLMVDAHQRAVLTDWDLATTVNHVDKGIERPGTIAFMAIDLLPNEYRKGEIERRYRHDIEGFIWIIVWVILRSKDGKIANYQLKSWNSTKCGTNKTYLLANYFDLSPTESWIAEWEIAIELLGLLKTFSAAQQKARHVFLRKWREVIWNLPHDTPEIQAQWNLISEVFSDEEVFMHFFKSIRNAVDEVPQLQYLYKIMPAGI